jgi:hypothetical protein
MGARQPQLFANEMDEKRSFFTVAAHRAAIHRQFDFRHDVLLVPPPGTSGII